MKVLKLGFTLLFTATLLVACTSASVTPDTETEGTHTELPFEIRSLDGSGNNPRQSQLGAVGLAYARVAEANYADGTGEIVEGPAARYISNRVFNDLAQNLFSENGVTQWGANWGQFLDHTMGLRDTDGEAVTLPFNEDDPLEDFGNDAETLRISRSAGVLENGVREQVNTISSYLDAWAVYGGTEERLEWLREGPVDGDLSNNSARLLTTEDNYLPRAVERGDASSAPEMEITGRLMALADAEERMIVAGDIRANENISLTAVQTLFLREHNRIVDALPESLSEEEKFQVARRVVGATQQYITYEEFLPAFGLELDRYRGYRPDVDPSVSNEFATVGYRAHSMVHGEVEVETEADRYTQAELDALRAAGIEVEVVGDEVEIAVPLNIAFANPDLVPQLGLGPILAGLAGEAQYKNDEQIDNQLRSVLFQLPSPNIEDPDACLDGPTLNECFGLVADLGTLDIFRARDHGMPYYNDMREAYGLPRVSTFAELTGEDSEDFPNDPEIDAADPINDPDILEFTELRDGEGNIIAFGTDAAEGEAIEGDRRTPLAARLKAIYGDVDKVDAFIGMVAEPHLSGSEFGALQYAMWQVQFEALRDGDRFFYTNDPALEWIEKEFDISYKRSLSQIIVDNTDISADEIQEKVFEVSN